MKIIHGSPGISVFAPISLGHHVIFLIESVLILPFETSAKVHSSQLKTCLLTTDSFRKECAHWKYGTLLSLKHTPCGSSDEV